VARSTAGTWGRFAVVLAAGLGAVVVSTAGPGSTSLRAVLVLLLFGCVVVASRRRPEPQGRGRTAEGAWQHVARELERSRRHGRPMALARIPMDAGHLESSTPAVEDRLTPALRATDHLWSQDGDVLVLLAEATSAQAQDALQRVVALLPDRATAAPLRIASFPEDGLTLTALCECLGGRRALRQFSSMAPTTADEPVEAAS
jgi:hypothetical protein